MCSAAQGWKTIQKHVLIDLQPNIWGFAEKFYKNFNVVTDLNEGFDKGVVEVFLHKEKNVSRGWKNFRGWNSPDTRNLSEVREQA